MNKVCGRIGSLHAVCYSRKRSKRFLVAVIFLGICSTTMVLNWYLSSSVIYKDISHSVYATRSTKYEYDDILNKARSSFNEFRAKKQKTLPPELQERLQNELKRATNKKIILFLSRAYRRAIKSDDLDVEKCGHCEITFSKRMINDSNVGAVVHHWDSFSIRDIPQRDPNQLHVYWCMEPPTALKNFRSMTLEDEDSFQFNATLTYRRTSDFFQPYRIKTFSEQSMGKSESYVQEMIKNKLKFGVAMVSNCGLTPGAEKRVSLLRELVSSGLKIDAYGVCFGRQFDYVDIHAKLSEYKFFFAFENSHHCNDYITEKFFDHSLLRGNVAVAWGGKKSDYEALAPPGSFIYAEDFESVAHLADYLNMLNENDEKYATYHRWRTLKPYAFEEGRSLKLCSLCRALHGINVDEYFRPDYSTRQPAIPLFSHGIAKRSVSLRQLFYESESRECLPDS